MTDLFCIPMIILHYEKFLNNIDNKLDDKQNI